jgi:aldehyde:ferredoxin oxidoreductase
MAGELRGYMHKILRVDLTAGKTRVDTLNPEYADKFIGGCGYAARTLFEILTTDADALSPANALFFIAGPMVGSGFPGATKWTVCFLSPLTSLWGESSASGFFGAEMKHAGFDGILFTGKSRDPVYLTLLEGNAQIRKANHLWGKNTVETTQTIRSDLGDRSTRVAAIGPAGEKLVRIASIVTDEERVCGRAGPGAVMGSKNLKAVAVRGKMEIPLADGDAVRKLSNEAREAVRPPVAPAYTVGRVEGLSLDGTAKGIEGLEMQGGLPVKNWLKGVFPEASKITGTTMSKTILARPGMCSLCSIITCWRYVRLGQDRPIEHGPEFETAAALGSLCMNSDLNSIVQANGICNRLGIDTISTGSVIAFAMECYEKGIIRKEEASGLDLSWGNSDSMLRLIDMIGKRKGFGAILGEGVKRASETLGRGSEEFALHVKGLELPMHEPRRWWTMALAYATSNIGAHHQQGMPAFLEWGYMQPEFGFGEKLRPFQLEGKVEATKFHQDFHGAFTAMGHCAFTIGGVIPFTIVSRAFTAVTGRITDHLQLLRCGERIWNLKRAFNVKMGISEQDDMLPKRFLEPLNEGAAAGRVPPIEEMLRRYYKLRSWENGKPSKKKLEELEMPEIAKDIWG